MNAEKNLCLTREKHLDHMVRVVPFIVFCYATQSFIILQITKSEFSSIGLSILGAFLALMIAGFIVHDLKHRAVFYETHLTISFLNLQKTISYQDIVQIQVNEPGQNFSNLIIKTSKSSHTFYFIDDGEKIKSWIESNQTFKSLAA
jgi:hypothetical protein